MPSNDEIQANVAIAELYADFLKYEKWIDFFAGEYLNKEGNSIYDCCDARRHLMEIRDELSERVSELCSQMQRRNVDILSPAWWRENGFCHNLNGEIK